MCPPGAPPVYFQFEPLPDAQTRQYFPARHFAWPHLSKPEEQLRVDRLYSSDLAAYLAFYREPSLLEYSKDPHARAYRVVRGVHAPALSFVVRVEKRSTGALMTYKPMRICSDDALSPGEGLAYTVQTKPLDEATWRRMSTCFDRTFWQQTSMDEVLVEDSLTTSIEGVRDGRFHAVVRQALDPGRGNAERHALARCVQLLTNLVRATRSQ